MQLGVVRNLDADVTEREVANGARHAPDDLAGVRDLLVGLDFAVDVEDAEAAVDLSPVVLARDRLLTRIAALREAHVGLRQPGLGGKHTLVDLAAPCGNRALDPPALEV